MDLNDPRRRLQVLNNASPSIRIASQPQQKLTVATAPTQPQPQISIAQPKQYNIAVPKAPAPDPNVPNYSNKFKGLTSQGTETKRLFGLDVGQFMGDFGKVTKISAGRDYESNADDFIKSYDGLNDDARRIYVNDVIKKAKEGDQVALNTAKVLNDKGKLGGTFSDFLEAANNKAFGWTMNAANFGKQKDVQEQLDNFTAGQIGKEFDPITVGTDIGLTIAGGAGAAKLVSKIPTAARIIEAGGFGAKAIPFLADSLGGGITQEAISQARGRDTSIAQDLATGTAIDVGANLVFKGAGKFTSLFRQGEKSASVVDDIIKEADPARIQQVMKIDNNLANYLAQETNPDTVKEVLRQMDMDPNIQLPDEVRKRLEEEGISAVRKKDNQYGAEYDPNDSSINFKDQSFATDTNAYHELGHHIFKNKLTPEEQALFKGAGEASQKAAGRGGYSQTDVNSEDFSDFMQKALTGRLDEIPEEFRSVVQKYAKVAASEAEQAGTKLLPAVTKSTRDLPSGVGDGFVFADKGTRGLRTIVDNIGKIDSQLSDIQMGKVSSTREEIAALQAKRSELIAKAQQPFNFAGADRANGIVSDEKAVAQRVDEISKAQAGTSDAPVLDSVKTTSPEDAGTTFANQVGDVSENGKNAVKTAENTAQAKSVDNTPVEANVESLIGKDTNPEDVQAILDAASRARGDYGNVLKARKQQHAQRANDAMRVFDESGGGEEGYKAMLSKLGGKYAESAYTPLQVEKEVSDRIINSVKKSKLQDWEKFNTMTSLRKIWGSEPTKPAEHDYQYIRRFFNEEYGDGVGDALAAELKDSIDKGRSIADIASEISGLPRALMATGDLSGGFRQALPLGTRYPAMWANANKLSVEWAFNPAKYNQAMKEIADSPNFNVITEKMGVDLTGVGAMQDEAFIGAGIAEKIPGFGHVVKGADRAYTGVLTKLRYDVANDIITKAGGPEKFVKNMEDLYGDDIVRKGLFGPSTGTRADRAMRAYGEFINTFSGRGGMKGGALDKHMQTASTLLFSPRLWAANINRLNPVWYARLYRDNPAAAKLAMQSQGTFMLMAASVLGLAAAAGAEVGSDPRSADFGKIKVGNTRYDILGGQQQNIVQFARQWTGEKVDSTTGEVDKLGDGFGVKTRFDLAFDMLENKSNPLVAFGIKLMETADGDTGDWLKDQFVRKDQYGNDFNVGEKALRLGIPLGLQGAYDTSDDVGDPVKGTLLNAPSFFGVGVQTYGNDKTKDFATNKDGKLAFGGKITDNMVLDGEGQPMLDEKGKIIKVKFDKDASEIEKKAALKKAANEAYTKKAKSLLSQEDADLYATGQADPNSLDQAQKDKFDQIKKWVSDYGKSVDIPKSVKSDAAKNFYAKYNTMTKKDQENWLKESPDENAKTVAAELNKQRVKGLPEYKPSNYLSKEYAEYEKDLLEHPEYTNIDKQNKARAFQTKAYKYNYSEDQRDIFNEGGSSDLKSLIDDGQVSKEDLDAAIKLDEELYNSGLTGSLKFSKKFRNNYGYGTPAGKGGSGGSGAGRGGSGSGGSGGGSGSGESKRAYLSAYVSNGTEGAKKEAPQFSSKRRTTGISFKDVSTPKKSNSKKVTINL